jgi:hypothetical protein
MYIIQFLRRRRRRRRRSGVRGGVEKKEEELKEQINLKVSTKFQINPSTNG